MNRTLDQTEKLIKYVADMHERAEEYNVKPTRVHEEIQDNDELKEIYEGIAGERICPTCEKYKMYDDKNEEYYCPIHDE